MTYIYIYIYIYIYNISHSNGSSTINSATGDTSNGKARELSSSSDVSSSNDAIT